ncbi:glycosyltransferase family 4 protein [Nitratireductor rhodophyticola]|uniref:glycosyltransferase family 4 protein n=1 Tax=Nitratireductor rhodophyticola TaxID=2854036 RepID=UPI003BAC74F9
MRIVIDMQGMQTASRTRGIGRYTHSFVRALLDNRGDHEILLALNGLFPDTLDPIRSAFCDVLPMENIRVWHAPNPGDRHGPTSALRRERAKIIREAFLASLQPDIVHVTSLFEGSNDNALVSIGALGEEFPTSVTHYDFIPLHHPERFLTPHPIFKKWYHEQLDQLNKANLLLAISEASALDAIKTLKLTNADVVNVSTACSKIFRPVDIKENEKDNFLFRLGIKKPFILVSGTVEPHKNTRRFFSAFSKIPEKIRQQYCIVLIGNSMKEHQVIQKRWARDAGLSDEEIVLTGYINDNDLVYLYNTCTLLAFPSFDEGFGLPILEAISCGAISIGSNTASIPEVAGCEDALFDPHDEISIANKLEQSLTDCEFRAALKKHGSVQARKFSWDDTALRSLQAMERLVAKRKTRATTPVLKRTEPLDLCIDAIARLSSDLPKSDRIELASSISRSIIDPIGKRQLLVDISELWRHDARTGCQRVTRSILTEVLKNQPCGFRVEPVYATIHRAGYRYARSFAARMVEGVSPGEDAPIDYRAGDIFFGLDFQPSIVRSQRNYLLDLKRNGVDIRFFVHDILSVVKPDWFSHGSDEVFRFWLETIGLFNGIIGNSKTTVDALANWYHENSFSLPSHFRFDWAHLGADIENSAPSVGLPEGSGWFLDRLALRPTFLMVSTIEPRKGYAQALAALEELWARGTDVNLVIVGKQGWKMDALVHKLRAHPELHKRLFWLEGISDEYLEKIYGAATCLIAASEGEGFGLPLIEAARHNLPILARDIPIFREVAGAHAAYFDGSSPSALADAVQKWLGAYQNGEHPRSDDMPWITWRQSAEQMMAALLRKPVTQSSGHSKDQKHQRERSVPLSA